MTKRYFVSCNGLILHEQPENGYTEMQAVERVQREINFDTRVLGLSLSESKQMYDVVDTKTFRIVPELRDAF